MTRNSEGNWDSQTGTWTRNTTTTGPAGQTTQRNTTMTRTEDGYTKSSTVTGPQGNTVTREAEGHWDPETQTWTRSITETGPGGKSAQRNITSTRTGDGYTKSSTVTGPQGNTVNRQVEGHWNPDTNTWSKSVVINGTEE